MLQILIFLFAAIGGILRFWLSLHVHVLGVPVATLLVNLLGTFCLPIWNERLQTSAPLQVKLKEAVGVGFFGALTTFSSMSLDTYLLVLRGTNLQAVIYLLLTIFGGISLTFLGTRIGINKKRVGD